MPTSTRKLLRASGIIDDSQMALADHNVIFDAQAGSAAVRKAKGALGLPAAGRYLNAPRVQIGLLAKNGFIKPFIPARVFGAVDQFATDDLEDFLRRLLAGANTVKKPASNQVDIPAAAKRANCSAVEVLRLILDKKLAWVGRDAATQGYLSVLVDVHEIRPMVRGADHGGLTLEAIVSRLSTADGVVRALIDGGHLKTITVINPVNRCPIVVVPTPEVDAFQAQYVSLFALAAQRGLHPRIVKKTLEADGIKPAMDPKKIGASFYRRTECCRDGRHTASPEDQEIRTSRRRKRTAA
jgi:hypothetical protein